MLIFDLKQLLFIVLLVLAASLILFLWLDRFIRYPKTSDPRGDMLLPVLEQVPFGYLVLSDMRIDYANGCARRWLGLERFDAVLPDADWVALLNEDRAAMRAALETGSVTDGRYRHVPISSNRLIHWWVFPADHADIVFVLDVTAQHQAKQTTQFLFSGFSHELRTPIATILTHLEVLSMSNLAPEVQQQSLRLLKQEAERMSRLVNQMLVLGHLETEVNLENRPVDLLSLVEDIVLQITPLAGERQTTLSVEADAPLPLIVGDAGRLKQVFFNLLDNAIKYTPPGGEVVVSLHRQNNMITCAVIDNGPGIAAEHFPHLTSRFYRAAPQEIQGSGLGLAIVAEILNLHQSKLVIESQTEDETGTRMRFDLPVVPAEEAA